jgi:hypothetical protein
MGELGVSLRLKPDDAAPKFPLSAVVTASKSTELFDLFFL